MSAAAAGVARPTAREAAVEATRERVLQAAVDAFRERWYDDVTLREVALAAGVALQTVVNRFGSKEALFAAATERIVDSVAAVRFAVEPGDVAGAVRQLVDDYERTGDATLRNLAVEDRVPVLRPLLARGRAGHEAWVRHAFGPLLDRVAPGQRDRRTAQLVVLTDVYSWKLLRRDRGFSPQDTAATLCELVLALDSSGGSTA